MFIVLLGVTLAVKTEPPAYTVRREVRDYLYPTAREHLKGKLNDFTDDIMKGKDVKRFEISELELNAYLYYLLNDVLLIGGKPLFKDPYLFLSPGRLTLRVDIPLRNAVEILANSMNKMALNENIKRLAAKRREETAPRGEGYTLSLTFSISFHWVKDHPYFYLERFYAGVMPVPVSVFFSDYQDQFNTMLWETFNKVFSMFPAYIRGMKVENKRMVFKTEGKVTDLVAATRQVEEFNNANPDLARALNSKNCLYGCTAKEKKALDKFYDRLGRQSAADVGISDLMMMKLVTEKMNERERGIRERNKMEMRGNKTNKPEQTPERVIYPSDWQ
jgi:hypothetical protein